MRKSIEFFHLDEIREVVCNQRLRHEVALKLVAADESVRPSVVGNQYGSARNLLHDPSSYAHWFTEKRGRGAVYQLAKLASFTTLVVHLNQVTAQSRAERYWSGNDRTSLMVATTHRGEADVGSGQFA